MIIKKFFLKLINHKQKVEISRRPLSDKELDMVAGGAVFEINDQLGVYIEPAVMEYCYTDSEGNTSCEEDGGYLVHPDYNANGSMSDYIVGEVTDTLTERLMTIIDGENDNPFHDPMDEFDFKNSETDQTYAIMFINEDTGNVTVWGQTEDGVIDPYATPQEYAMDDMSLHHTPDGEPYITLGDDWVMNNFGFYPSEVFNAENGIDNNNSEPNVEITFGMSPPAGNDIVMTNDNGEPFQDFNNGVYNDDMHSVPGEVWVYYGDHHYPDTPDVVCVVASDGTISSQDVGVVIRIENGKPVIDLPYIDPQE